MNTVSALLLVALFAPRAPHLYPQVQVSWTITWTEKPEQAGTAFLT